MATLTHHPSADPLPGPTGGSTVLTATQGAGAARGGPTLDDYTGFALRHARSLVVCIGLGLLLGALWALQQPKTYSATASVVLPPVPTYVSMTTIGRLPRDVTIDTDAQLIHSPSVLTAVSQSVDEDRDEVLERLRVTAVPLSRVLEVTYTTDSPSKAARAATAAAESFIEARGSALGALQQAELDRLGLRVAELQDRLDARSQREQFVPLGDPLAEEIAVLRQRYDQLEQSLEAPAELNERADPPTTPNSTNPEVPVTSGAMMGLLVGCLVGRLRDRRTAREPEGSPTDP